MEGCNGTPQIYCDLYDTGDDDDDDEGNNMNDEKNIKEKEIYVANKDEIDNCTIWKMYDGSAKDKRIPLIIYASDSSEDCIYTKNYGKSKSGVSSPPRSYPKAADTMKTPDEKKSYWKWLGIFTCVLSLLAIIFHFLV